MYPINKLILSILKEIKEKHVLRQKKDQNSSNYWTNVISSTVLDTYIQQQQNIHIGHIVIMQDLIIQDGG